MPKRKRKIPIQIYLSEDENYILTQKWKISGMKSKSAYIRHLILYGCTYDVDYSDLREYNTTLSRISGSLNQIAKRINTTGHIYDDDMKEVKEIMKKIWHTQKYMLSRQPSIKQ